MKTEKKKIALKGKVCIGHLNESKFVGSTITWLYHYIQDLEG